MNTVFLLLCMLCLNTYSRDIKQPISPLNATCFVLIGKHPPIRHFRLYVMNEIRKGQDCKYELPDKGHNSWRPRRLVVYYVHDGLIIHMEN
jgi:hypothetical protein